MTWFKVDDGFWSHPKTANLDDSAVALWARAGAYCCQHLTDGFVGRPVLRMVGTAESAEDLVDAGLWVEVDGGWLFHDWGDYQETRAAVEARREAARERKRRGRETQRSRRESRRDIGVTDAVTHSGSHGVSHAGVTAGVTAVPTRPDPTRPDHIKDSPSPAARPTTRTSTYPDDFEDFWKTYPRKEGKRKALTAWQRARKRATNEELIAGAARYRDDPNRVDQYTKHGERWLNSDGWLDESLPSRSSPDAQPALTTRQKRFIDAELLKDNPDPRALAIAREHGYAKRPDSGAAPDRAGLRQPDDRSVDGVVVDAVGGPWALDG